MPQVGALAALVHGTVVGDSAREIRDVADLAHAGPDALSFLANPKYQHLLEKSRAGAVLVAAAVPGVSCTQIVCDNPYLAMAQIAVAFHPPDRPAPGIEPGAHVHPEARVAESATIRVGAVVERGAKIAGGTVVGPLCYVGIAASIGESSYLHAGVKVLARCKVGARVILHAGVVVGSDGFGYAPDEQGHRHKIPQVGIVDVGDDVEIGANTTIDRATFGETVVGQGSKIDNLVQIAHNVELGRDCVIVSQVGISGSAHLGNRVVVGGQAGIAGHLTIHDDVMLAGRTGVAGDISAAGVFSGVPAMPHHEWLRVIVAQKSVPELRRRVRELEDRIKTLENSLSAAK